MKSAERRHLKENELAQTLASVREVIEPRRKQITTAVIAIVVLAVAIIAVIVIRQRSQTRGQELLAQAMVAMNARVIPATPGQNGDLPAAAQFGATGTFSTEEAKLNAALPKLRAAADAYPDSNAGVTARYHLAGALAALGRAPEAVKEYDEVEKRAGSGSLYARMARLGKADVQARSGQLDAAITTWKQMAADTNGDLPQDAILMELARAYIQKGNTADAKKTFSEIVDKHPDSPYVAEARTELENLKS